MPQDLRERPYVHTCIRVYSGTPPLHGTRDNRPSRIKSSMLSSLDRCRRGDEIQDQIPGFGEGIGTQSLDGVISGVQKRRVGIEEGDARNGRLRERHVIREKRAVCRLEFHAESARGGLQRIRQFGVAVWRKIEVRTAEVAQEDGGGDITGMLINTQHLNIKAASE